jgi:hypothetical protein
MKIHFNLSGVGHGKWSEHVLRFAFGGAMTAFAGIVAKEFGPVVGGLFLAFPAIFPASASLVDEQEKRKKQRHELPAGTRGRAAVALDASGAAMGACGLVAFAFAVWKLLPNHPIAVVITFSTLIWFVVSVAIWRAAEAL